MVYIKTKLKSMLFIIMVTIIIIVIKYTCAFEESQNFLELCLLMPYLQSVNNMLLLGEDGKQRLRQRVMTFDWFWLCDLSEGWQIQTTTMTYAWQINNREWWCLTSGWIDLKSVHSTLTTCLRLTSKLKTKLRDDLFYDPCVEYTRNCSVEILGDT